MGLNQLILSIDSSVSTFVLVPLPMFILMGTVMFHSGVAFRMIDVLDQWLGRIAGRLAVLAIGAGALFATLTGVAMGSVAMLGSTLSPDMERRGYAKSMSLGPILASGSLAIMIPPSALAVILASLGRFSVGKLLIAIIVPGLLLALIYVAYIVIRCHLQPSLAPAYAVEPTPLPQRLADSARYVLPPVSVILLVIGSIFLGIATPTEAAAVGALLSFVVAALYGRLTWEVTKKAVGLGDLALGHGSPDPHRLRRVRPVVELFRRHARDHPARDRPAGASHRHPDPDAVRGDLSRHVHRADLHRDGHHPDLHADRRRDGLGPGLVRAIMVLNLEMATISPPFGLSLFVMKGIASPSTTMNDVYRAALPFVGLNLIVMAVMIAFPGTVLWLPGLMD